MNTTSLYFATLRSALVERLQQEKPLVIEFVKKDGSLRKMEATLSEEVINADESLQTEKVSSVHPINLNLLRVVDTEINVWRSFNISDLVIVGGMGVGAWFIDNIQYPIHQTAYEKANGE